MENSEATETPQQSEPLAETIDDDGDYDELIFPLIAQYLADPDSIPSMSITDEKEAEEDEEDEELLSLGSESDSDSNMEDVESDDSDPEEPWYFPMYKTFLKVSEIAVPLDSTPPAQ